MNAVIDSPAAVSDSDSRAVRDMPGCAGDIDEREVVARLAAAVSVARAAVESVATDGVGVHVDAVAEGPCAVTHYFEADVPGYRGWQWCAVLAGYPGGDDVTVSEVALLPGSGALIAPAWVPWADRVRAGDLSAGDVLAAPADDPRLVPGYFDNGDRSVTDDPQVSEVMTEVGLGRRRLLSYQGRDRAVRRWISGDYGPEADMAHASRLRCGDCGFFIPVSGALRVQFGVCANEFSADGHVVHHDYGCGAHSDVTAPEGENAPQYDPFDDGAFEVVIDRSARASV